MVSVGSVPGHVNVPTLLPTASIMSTVNVGLERSSERSWKLDDAGWGYTAGMSPPVSVSYTHLTLPTNREV